MGNMSWFKHPSVLGPIYDFNYKGSHSIVVLAVCDAHYRFTLLDIRR